MKTNRRLIPTLIALAAVALPAAVQATTHSTVGAGGYDLVSYRTGEKPVRGNGNHLVVYEGVTYLFQSDENKRRFERDPERFVPAYGGYCAYGVAVGKKFVGDPDVWAIVDDRLYLNLDTKVQGLWNEDVPGHIVKADARWPRIRPIPADEL